MSLHDDRIDQRLDPDGAGSIVTPIPTSREILTASLPELSLFDRCLLRTVALATRPHVLAVHGTAHIAPARDPFILACNHSTRMEAIWLPAMLVYMRRGRRLHFLADWNFRMIPGVGLLYRRAGAITVGRKSARPRILNALKPLYTDRRPPLEVARAHIEAGRSIALFPEGTVNRDPSRLLRGRYGTARLSLTTGCPVVPAGLRFPSVPPGTGVPDPCAFEVIIGEPLVPPSPAGTPRPGDLYDWHARIMTEIARLSGKSWLSPSRENG